MNLIVKSHRRCEQCSSVVLDTDGVIVSRHAESKEGRMSHNTHTHVTLVVSATYAQSVQYTSCGTQ